jgi:hypothetical protein
VSGRAGDGSRRLLWGLLAALLLGAAAFGTLLSVFGLEALTTGANVGAWVFWFSALVVVPLAAVGYCVSKAFRPR